MDFTVRRSAFERKMPEFFRDWRFLFVGFRWWMNKVRGRA
jgi:hypothetical protein